MEECLTIHLVGQRILSDDDDSLLFKAISFLKLSNIVNLFGENLKSCINSRIDSIVFLISVHTFEISCTHKFKLCTKQCTIMLEVPRI